MKKLWFSYSYELQNNCVRSDYSSLSLTKKRLMLYMSLLTQFFSGFFFTILSPSVQGNEAPEWVTWEIKNPVKWLAWYKWRGSDIWTGSLISQLQGWKINWPTQKIPDHKLPPPSRNCNPFRLFKMHDEAKGAKPGACPVWSQGHSLCLGRLSWCNSWRPYKALCPNKKRQSCPCDVHSSPPSSWCVLETKMNFAHSCATSTKLLLSFCCTRRHKSQ